MSAADASPAGDFARADFRALARAAAAAAPDVAGARAASRPPATPPGAPPMPPCRGREGRREGAVRSCTCADERALVHHPLRTIVGGGT